MIPFGDLPGQYRAIKGEIDQAVMRVLESGGYVLGPEVEAFEAAFAESCACRHAVAVNSGTSALHLALLAAGIGPGDEVITTPMTFVATIAAIQYAGARPVLVDIDPRSRNLDPERVEAAITPKSKALLPVHLHGLPAEMDPLAEIAGRHGLTLIEDAAQAHGARYRGRPAGSMGALGCFSFYPGKNLGAYGEGGAVTSNDPALAEKVRILRDWGLTARSHHAHKGFNYRMDALQGAILGVKLGYLEDWTQARRQRAARYAERLMASAVALPHQPDHSRHVYHVYAVELQDRDRVQRRLADARIQTNIHYPTPVHLQPAYADLGYGPGAFPHAEALARRQLSLPLYPELPLESLDRVADRLLASCAA